MPLLPNPLGEGPPKTNALHNPGFGAFPHLMTEKFDE